MDRRGDQLQRQSWLSCGDSGAAVVGDFRGACKIVPDCLGPPIIILRIIPLHKLPTGTESSANGVLQENHVFTVANLSEYPRLSLRLVVRPEYLSSSSPKAIKQRSSPFPLTSPLIRPPWYSLGTAPHAMTSRLEPCPVRCRCLLLIYSGVDHGSMLREALAGKLRQLQTLELFSSFLVLTSAADSPSLRRSRCRGTDYPRLPNYSRLLKALKDYSGYSQCRPDPQ
ncbi:uncharacterized protein BDW70DRAFT_167310 [Aspergillus foveolatus]|uniref:uncharacterized protein n=1 Tax=Aspergillus foveolatus TaxID=210207 RepID=UPI003CCD364A